MNARLVHFLAGMFLGLALLWPARLPAATWGEAPPYKSRLWLTEEDPTRNMVQSVVRTPDGFLWVGTQGGLARFDGERFTFFPLGVPGNPRQQRVNALGVDAAGILWVGTSQGLFQQRETGWRQLVMPTGADETILSLYCDPDGVMWVGTRVGLVRAQGGTLSLVGDATATESLERNTAIHAVRSIAAQNRREFWISAADNILLLRDGQAVTNENLSQFRPDFMRAVCCRQDGSVWIGTHAGLIRYHHGQYTQFTQKHGLPSNTITALHEDRRGNFWVGTHAGLCRLLNGEFTVEMRAEGEPYDQIFCFYEDKEDNLWVGSKEGLHQLNMQPFTAYTTRQGLAHNNVISVYEDAAKALWIGTGGGGLHVLRNGQLKIYATTNTPVLGNDLVLAIHATRDGSLWFGEDYEGGLYQMKTGKISHYGMEEGIPRSGIRDLLEDQAGRLLIGHASAGLGIMEKGKARFLTLKNGLPSMNLRCLLQSRAGPIWVGTEAGLCSWITNKFTTYTRDDGLADNMVLALYEDGGQDLWIGTDKGLGRRHGGHFRNYAAAHVDFNTAILEILEDDFGQLWLATRHGVIRIKKQELDDYDAGIRTTVTPEVFGKGDGMASQLCVGVAKPSAWRSRDGRLWFATTKGLAMTNPRWQISKNLEPPPVIIREVRADKRVMGAATTGTGLEVPPGRGDLEFYYTALSFAAPERNRFRYKLEGFDPEWVDAAERHEARYNSVPPGRYTFRVLASNNDGVWNETGRSVSLVLQPHFWQTWWFRILIAGASLSLAAAAARAVTRRRMLQKLQKLEEQNAVERERARIAQDMHDELGASLTQVAMLSDMALARENEARELCISKTSQVARDLVRNLDAIVWSVNPKNDSLEKFALYICEYLQMFFGTGPVSYRVEIPDELPAWPLSAEVRHNLYLVLKEALHNVVKHAQASEVRVRIALEGNVLQLRIEDNGRGFTGVDKDHSAFGNGLHNMEKRMRDIGGEFHMESTPGQGTRVAVAVAMKKGG